MDNHKRFYDKKWNFEEGSMKELVHGLHPYPAMMMPLIARTIFEEYNISKNSSFLDPYVGSGTTLVEAQNYGIREAIGIDLNPLAISISKAKLNVYDCKELKRLVDSFQNYLSEAPTNVINNPNYYIPDFPIMTHWFKKETINDLAIIRKFVFSITEEPYLSFFKVCFSETVRDVSMTRNGEFKLYRINKSRIDDYNPNTILKFSEIIYRNYDYIKNYSKYQHNSYISLINDSTQNVLKCNKYKNYFDIVITSPPYGDSHTTVAYGQFSRLSNEWLGIKEAGKIDKKLLGGSKQSNYIPFGISELDNAIKQIMKADNEIGGDRYKSVVSFYEDYRDSIDAVAKSVKQGGIVVYVVGNRRVRNVELPLDIITYKMFEKHGFNHEVTYVRDILNKRMPAKASPEVQTMTNEFIVIMRKY